MSEHSQQSAVSGQGSTYWPRRLLHIPTMCSMELGEHETYKTHRQPRYATLSYTWGRYEKPEAPSLPVLNVPWHMPSVDPTYFTVAQMQTVIDSIQSICHLDFIWLDIACLDFSRLNAGLDDGVANQREIFASTTQSFVWLSQTPKPILSKILEDLQEALIISQSGPTRYRHQDEMISYLRHKALPAMRDLLKDPWFTSLWTLQEAMVNPSAILLPRNGEPISPGPQISHVPQKPRTVEITYLGKSTKTQITSELLYPVTWDEALDSPSLGYMSLQHLASLCQLIKDMLDWCNVPAAHCPLLQELDYLVSRSGLPKLLHFNVLKLWDLARDRTKGHSKIQLEYLYRSILGTRFATDQSMSLDDTSFARHLLAHFPVSAQVFIREDVQRKGMSWLYTTDCKHPNMETLFESFDQIVPQISLSLSSDLQLEFKGHALGFSLTMDQFFGCRSTTRLICLSLDRSDIQIGRKQEIMIPAMSAIPCLRPMNTHGTATWDVDPAKQAAVVEHLVMLMGHGVQNTKILLLASNPQTQAGTPSLAIGLVIHQISERTWQRLGWCCWVHEIVPQRLASSEFGGTARNIGLDGLSMSYIEGYAG